MKSATILLVDDDADHQNIHSAMLRHAGYSLLLATTVTQGFAIARTERPDLIVTDLQFERQPRGLDLIAVLQADPATRDIPLVAYSAFTDFHAEKLRELGVRNLMKGGTPMQLVETVGAILAERRLEREGGGG